MAELSSVFDWYREEFEKEAGTLERYIAPYITDAEAADAFSKGELKIRFLDFDWGLNGTPPAGTDGACAER